MKKITVMLLGAILSISALADKIAVVDVSKAIDSYSGSKVASQSLNSTAKKLENEANVKAQALEKEKNALLAKGNNLTEAEKSSYQKKVEDFQKYLQSNSEKFAHEQNAKLDAIHNKLIQALEAVVKAEGYDYVFAKGAILVGGDDITEKVIKKMEAMK